MHPGPATSPFSAVSFSPGVVAVLDSTSANPGASIVWAVGSSGTCCTANPLVLRNG
ncbi:MAG: hypothetical protein ABSF03_09340 [Streptosporangiaceae bacterium]